MYSKLANHRLLIISNNVLSMTRSNGKVIMSYFDCLPKDMVRQLYFSSELPSIKGYQYYQISDKDIINGFINKRKRGRSIVSVNENNYQSYRQNSNKVKTPLFRLLRECLWSCKRWLSPQLISWLDNYIPTDIFFVGGDSLFAYKICRFINKRYKTRLSLYLTDDYILPRKYESPFAYIRRTLIKSSLKKCVEEADQFFTISRQMKSTYAELFSKDSYLVTNMSDVLRDDTIKAENDKTVLLYAGSLYYGRAEILRTLAESLKEYNKENSKKAILRIFTNVAPTQDEMKTISVTDASEYCGRLTKDELVVEMNKSHVLCIVESFDEKQIENTRLSLSTKVSEYMSVGKPILAIGPKQISTMDYLSDVAVCATNKEKIQDTVYNLLKSEDMQIEYGQRAYDKFLANHVKDNIQDPFINLVFGETDSY